MSESQNEGIRMPIPPPLYAILPLVIGLIIHYILFPLNFLPIGGIQFAIGLLLSIIGAVVMLTAGVTLVKAKTDSTFSNPTTTIVSHGIYSFSRNPIYLGVIILYSGLATVFNSLWPIFFLPLVIYLFHFKVILKEENYLERTFGDRWLKYRSKVRRWL